MRRGQENLLTFVGVVRLLQSSEAQRLAQNQTMSIYGDAIGLGLFPNEANE
jgi:hypothetical protein